MFALIKHLPVFCAYNYTVCSFALNLVNDEGLRLPA